MEVDTAPRTRRRSDVDTGDRVADAPVDDPRIELRAREIADEIPRSAEPRSHTERALGGDEPPSERMRRIELANHDHAARRENASRLAKRRVEV